MYGPHYFRICSEQSIDQQNVLVDKHGTPCICDFGVSKIINRRGFTTSNVGTAPYMAPELFLVIDGTALEQSPRTTKSSDVYSYALLVLEVCFHKSTDSYCLTTMLQILTSEAPKGRPSKIIVTAEILAQLQPRRVDYDVDKVTSVMWSVLTRCWNFDPQLRPPISQVLRELDSTFRASR